MRGSVFTSTGELNLLDELPTRTKYLPAGRTRLRLKSWKNKIFGIYDNTHFFTLPGFKVVR